MANTSAVYARIDDNLKENAENILAQLGITPSSAIQMLYRQIILQRGLPFDLHLPPERPVAIGGMSHDELNRELPVDRYVVYYLVNDEEHMVNIVRIFYGGRDAERLLQEPH